MQELLSDKPEIEYFDGLPYRKVSPRRTHSLVQSALIRIVTDCAADRGEVGPEWRFTVGGTEKRTELMPDISYVSNERMDAVSGPQAEQPPFAPDLAIEIRSPSHRAGLLKKKIVRYLMRGAVLVLDVIPEDQRIIAHTSGDVRTYDVNEIFEHEVLPWLRFPVGSIFPKPR